MAEVNRRPPFMFHLSNEIDQKNNNYFCLKKEELAQSTLYTPLQKVAKEILGKDWKAKINDFVQHKKAGNL